jgi:hypothetical protein
MDPITGFFDRLDAARTPLTVLFCAGFSVAVWDPKTKVVLTLALGITCGMLVLGPYSAAALYATRLQSRFGGHLRWPVCLLLSVSAVLLLDTLVHWSHLQLALAGLTASLGTVFGHDAVIAILELRSLPGGRVDPWMVFLFPVIVGLAVLAGYCSLGFGIGLYHLIDGLV